MLVKSEFKLSRIVLGVLLICVSSLFGFLIKKSLNKSEELTASSTSQNEKPQQTAPAQQAYALQPTAEAANIPARISIVLITANVGVGKPRQAAITFINSGQTPADRIHTMQALGIVTAPNFPDFVPINAIFKMTTAPEASIAAGFGGTVYTQRTPAVFSQEDIDNINSGKVRLFVYGKIEYLDAHGNSHWMTYSAFYDPMTGTFEEADEGNNSDTNPGIQNEVAPNPGNDKEAPRFEVRSGGFDPITSNSVVSIADPPLPQLPFLILAIEHTGPTAHHLVVAILTSLTEEELRTISPDGMWKIPWKINDGPFCSGWMLVCDMPLEGKTAFIPTLLFPKEIKGRSIKAEIVVFSDETEPQKIPITLQCGG